MEPKREETGDWRLELETIEIEFELKVWGIIHYSTFTYSLFRKYNRKKLSPSQPGIMHQNKISILFTEMDQSICNFIGFNNNGQIRVLILLIPYFMLLILSKGKRNLSFWNLFHSDLVIEVSDSNLYWVLVKTDAISIQFGYKCVCFKSDTDLRTDLSFV